MFSPDRSSSHPNQLYLLGARGLYLEAASGTKSIKRGPGVDYFCAKPTSAVYLSVFRVLELALVRSPGLESRIPSSIYHITRMQKPEHQLCISLQEAQATGEGFQMEELCCREMQSLR